jgi:hypothetical protein
MASGVTYQVFVILARFPPLAMASLHFGLLILIHTGLSVSPLVDI